MDELHKITAWIFDETNITKNVLPSVRIGNTTLYGPADGLTDTRFFEFLRAAQNFQLYMHSKKQDDLNKFIASLYRPCRANYTPDSPTESKDPRVPFNDDYIDYNAKVCAQMSETQKQSIVLFFKGCCASLEVLFPEAFHGPKADNKYGIHGTIEALAGEKWGNPEKVSEQYLYYILISICNFERNKPKE